MLALGGCAKKVDEADAEPPTTDESPTPTSSTGEGTPLDPVATKAFRLEAETYLGARFELRPNRGVEVGLHDYDGKIRDVSETGLKAEVTMLERMRERFEGIDAATLEPRARVELGVIRMGIRGDLFEISRLRKPWRDPMMYLGDLNLVPYISREYAPAKQRVAAVIAIAEATPKHLEHAQKNLDAALPRTFVETALMQTRGTITFVDGDVKAALGDALGPDGEAALGRMKEALTGYATFLEERLAKATDDYPLGPELFMEMLRETQGFEVDLATLTEVGQRDLAVNYQAILKAAEQIDAKTPPAITIGKVKATKGPDVLKTATAQAADMRKFLLDEKIVSIPSEDVAVVVETPPFMRWNAAFLDNAGAFETAKLPSFYYISPPDPSWPKAEQDAYLPSDVDLLFITVHEVWPGHFLHGLHMKANESRVLKTHWNYATGEGWAHYAEEMMWQEGISDDPSVRVGQLLNALLRNVRYMSAIGLHTGDLDVPTSEKMFRDKAFQDDANARQQAVRGTFDPMYLAYTLGKLAIKKLRRDIEARETAAGREFSLQAFHDQLLSYGSAPLPVIREAMLGPNPGPLL